jgi:hypothetical protein
MLSILSLSLSECGCSFIAGISGFRGSGFRVQVGHKNMEWNSIKLRERERERP